MFRPRPLTLATCIHARASSRVRPWTRVHLFLLHTQYLYYAFSLKSAFRRPPQPPFLHTSPNSGQSSFPLLHLSGLVRLSAASLKGCTTTLLSIKIHGRGKAPPMNIQHLPRTFRSPVKKAAGLSACNLYT